MKTLVASLCAVAVVASICGEAVAADQKKYDAGDFPALKMKANTDTECLAVAERLAKRAGEPITIADHAGLMFVQGRCPRYMPAIARGEVPKAQ